MYWLDFLQLVAIARGTSDTKMPEWGFDLLFHIGSSAKGNSNVKSFKSPSYLLLLGASNKGSTDPIIGYEGGPGILFTRRTKRALLTMRGSRVTAANINSVASTIVGSIICEIHLYSYYFTDILLSTSVYSAPIVQAPKSPIAHDLQQFHPPPLLTSCFRDVCFLVNFR